LIFVRKTLLRELAGMCTILVYSTPGFAALTFIIAGRMGLFACFEYSIPRAEIIRDSSGGTSSIEILDEGRLCSLVGARIVPTDFMRERVDCG
jgi:hypothetical protein